MSALPLTLMMYVCVQPCPALRPTLSTFTRVRHLTEESGERDDWQHLPSDKDAVARLLRPHLCHRDVRHGNALNAAQPRLWQRGDRVIRYTSSGVKGGGRRAGGGGGREATVATCSSWGIARTQSSHLLPYLLRAQP